MENFQCENCGLNNCRSGVFLDIKNVGKYPDEVTHSYGEERLKCCGDCGFAVHKILRERRGIQQNNEIKRELIKDLKK